MQSRRSFSFALLGLCGSGLACNRSHSQAQPPKQQANKAAPATAQGSNSKAAAPVSPTTDSEDTAAMEQSTQTETVVLAGGCFWGMEEIIRAIPGVIDTEVGYAGGRTASPTYNDVRTGSTGHAESVRIVFDPSKLSFAELLEKWFFRMHDPTTKDRQGNDRGSQYRSAIFYSSEEQKSTALAVIERVNQSNFWSSPVVTEVVAAGPFTPAEGYHQDYLQKNPGGYTCHYMRGDDVF